MAVCDIVVIGSYPPMPGPGTAATLGAVRRAWAQGANVAMVAYRTGAAPVAVPVAGPLAGWRLEQVRRHFGGPAQVAVSVQKGVPFCDRRLWARWVTAIGLAVAMRRFTAATVVLGEDPGIGRLPVRLLARGASRVSVPDDQLAQRLVRRYRLPPDMVDVDNVAPFPVMSAAQGAEGLAGGLYDVVQPDQLVYVELPATSTSQRLKARLQRSLPGFARRLRRH